MLEMGSEDDDQSKEKAEPQACEQEVRKAKQRLNILC